MHVVDNVDPFWGNGASEYRASMGIEANWYFLKAQCGNTTPAASLPFSAVRVHPWSGGYPTGYGCNAPNSCGRPPKMQSSLYRGFTHFAQSGTGAIGHYYNLFRVEPFPGGEEGFPLVEEKASPGFYSARIPEAGLSAELTVTHRAALHRYRREQKGKMQLRVLLCAQGLDASFGKDFAQECSLLRAEGLEDSLVCSIRFAGFTVHACILAKEQDVAIRLDGTVAVFEWAQTDAAELTLGFSFTSAENATESAREAPGFDKAHAMAQEEWEATLARVEVDTACGELRQVMASALYTALLKPALCDTEYCVDIATLWDIYKTQFPLISLLYPGIASKIINSLLHFARYTGHFDNCYLMADTFSVESQQADLLAAYMIADAYYHHVPGIDYHHALGLLHKDFFSHRYRDYRENGKAPSHTRLLDFYDVAGCLERLAQAMGEGDMAADFAPYAEKWRTVFDEGTGLLWADGPYYEGTHWNYSFRLLQHMQERVALAGGKERFSRLLTSFFRFEAGPVRQLQDPQDEAHRIYGETLHSFEGFNNESDMEAPYALLWAGRPDLLSDIMAAMSRLFHPGQGGIPGNEDSGGLSSCYLFNMLGIFPVTGMPYMLLGCPQVDGATLRLPSGNDFIITVSRETKNSHYVKSVALNQAPLNTFAIPIDTVLEGGTLAFEMTDMPCGMWQEPLW